MATKKKTAKPAAKKPAVTKPAKSVPTIGEVHKCGKACKCGGKKTKTADTTRVHVTTSEIIKIVFVLIKILEYGYQHYSELSAKPADGGK